MRTLSRVLIGVSLLLICVGIGMDYFGYSYASDRTTIKVLTGWDKTDWATSVWTHRGFIAIELGVAVGLIPFAIGLIRRLNSR